MKINQFRPLFACGVLAAMLSGCGESSDSKQGADFGGPDKVVTPPPVTSFDQSALIANISDNIITPAYQSFKTLGDAQQLQVQAYCDSETNAGADRNDAIAALSLAQQSWKDAMAQWQQIEVMQIGPLTLNSSTLRNNIYSWPVTSSCGVDQDVVYFDSGMVNTTPYEINKRTATRRGLDALEYLLFNDNSEHSCTTAKDILANWNNKELSEKRVLRCNFAVEVANDLVNNAATLVEQWSGATGYADTLKQAGTANNKFATAHDGVNEISDALFYIDKMTKDAKLATPLGFFGNDCGGVGSVCAQAVESPYSDNSIANLINNLKGFQLLFNGQGNDPENTLGFDDYLIDVNDSATATQMLSDTDIAISDLQSYSTSLAASVNTDSSQGEASHAKVKAITDQLKVDFINSLALKLPQTAAGDND